MVLLHLKRSYVGVGLLMSEQHRFFMEVKSMFILGKKRAEKKQKELEAKLEKERVEKEKAEKAEKAKKAKTKEVKED